MAKNEHKQRHPKEPRFRQYVDYIRNTGRVPLKVEMFDEDWEPIGPMVRRDMVAARLLVERPVGLFLTDVLRADMCAELTDAELMDFLKPGVS